MTVTSPQCHSVFCDEALSAVSDASYSCQFQASTTTCTLAQHLHEHHISSPCHSNRVEAHHPQSSAIHRLFLSTSVIPTVLAYQRPSQTAQMPNNIPNFQVANFLATNTKPLLLADLAESTDADSECPICRSTYADPPQNYVHPDLPEGEAEYAVQIHNRGGCMHIFGRRCLEHHICGGNPWSHTCPLCRTEWFPAPSAGRREMLMDIERTLTALAALELVDGQARQELVQVEAALDRIREALYESRWI